MTKSTKKIIAFDLDGIVIDRPPIIPKKLLELLYRGLPENGLHYRCPRSKFEIAVRRLSHLPVFRPPIDENVRYIKSLKRKNKYRLIAISSRYSFLKDRTKDWFNFYKLGGLFDHVFLNEKNDQPHEFKYKKLKMLKPSIFVDDDALLINYLRMRIKDVELINISHGGSIEEYIKGKSKILFALTYYRPYWTGLTKYAADVAEGLATRGHKIEVVTTKYKSSLKTKEMINKVVVYRTVSLFRLSRTQFSPLFLYRFFQRMLSKDVVVVYLPLVESLLVVLISKLFRKKVILVHNGDLVLPKGIFNRLMERIYYFTSSLSIKYSDKIVVHTKDYSRNSKLLSKFKDKWEIVIPPCEMTRASVEDIRTFKRKYKLVDSKLVGFIGRFVDEKGIVYLLKAIPHITKEFPGAHFIFAGEKNVEYENYWDVIEPLFRKYKSFITHVGLINGNKELEMFYSSLDVLVVPSKTDCFPLVQVESVLCGTPLVCSDIPGARQVVIRSKMGLLAKSKDPKSLAKEIVKLLKNKKRYTQLNKKIRTLFSASVSIDRYENLIKS